MSKCKTYHQSLKRRKTDRLQGRSRKPHNVPLCHSRRPGQATLQQLPTFSVSSVKQEDSGLSTRPAGSHTSTALSSRPADYPVTARFRASSAHSMNHRPSRVCTGSLRKRNKNCSLQRHPEQTAVGSTNRKYLNVHWHVAIQAPMSQAVERTFVVFITSSQPSWLSSAAS